MSSNLWIVWETSYRPVYLERRGRKISNGAWNAKRDVGVSGGASIVHSLAQFVAIACDTHTHILLFIGLNVGPEILSGVRHYGK